VLSGGLRGHATPELRVTYPWRRCVGASERTGRDRRGYARMLWRRAEDRWAKERRGRRRPGGTRRAGGSAVGVTEEGWGRRLLEKGGTLSSGAVAGRQGSWPPPIYSRWWATLPNAREFKISQSLREGNCKRSSNRGCLRGVFRPSLCLLLRAVYPQTPAISCREIARSQPRSLTSIF
jgi:hypothetical protein